MGKDDNTVSGNNHRLLYRALCMILITAAPVLSAQEVLINEFLASNSNILADPDDHDYSDWIEMANLSSAKIDLGGYFLSDNIRDTTKWAFPAGTEIPASGYLLVWADGKNKIGNAIHTNFRLEKSGEEIALFSPSGECLDTVVYRMQETNVSSGRVSYGNWQFFPVPTPGTQNNTGFFQRAECPDFSLAPGFYTETRTLELSVATPGAEIRYTLDNTIPDLSSNLYTGPISIESRQDEPGVYSLIRTNQDPYPWLPDWVPPAAEIFKATVVRARTFEEGKEPSNTLTRTYFVDDNIDERYPTIAVISLVTEPDNLFDYNTGIYVPGENHIAGESGTGNYFMDWEKPAHIEFYEPGGTMGFSQDVGIRIQGGSSPASPQKGLHIIARNEYGSNRIDYPIFKNSGSKAKDLTEFKRFIIRAWGSMICGTLFSDAYAQSLFETSSLDIQAYRPAVVFINGEYWGLQEVREANKNSWYYQFHYGIDRDDPGFDILEHEGSGTDPYTSVDEGDLEEWNDLVDFVMTNDMADPNNYRIVGKKIDLDNFITYFGHCIYTCKWDWPNNNDGSWKPRIAGTKWKWIQFDMETCFGVATELGPQYELLDASYNMLNHVFLGVRLPMFGQYGPHHLAQKLVENSTFRDMFIRWFETHMQQEFLPENMNARLDSMMAGIEPYMEEYRNRWPFIMDFNNDWEYSLQLVRDFIEMRPQYMHEHLLEMFGPTSIEPVDPQHIQSNTSFCIRSFPNPVRGSARFQFFLPAASQVKLSLYNLAGQEIDIVTERFYSAGKHDLTWDPYHVPVGSYFYRINAGRFTGKGKILLLE